MITVSVCADGFCTICAARWSARWCTPPTAKLRPEEIPRLLALGDRRLTGPTMPPQGLYLNRVWYDGAVGELFARD